MVESGEINPDERDKCLSPLVFLYKELEKGWMARKKSRKGRSFLDLPFRLRKHKLCLLFIF